MSKFDIEYDSTDIDPDTLDLVMRESRKMRARYLQKLAVSAITGLKTIARESLNDLNQAITRVGELMVGSQENLLHKK